MAALVAALAVIAVLSLSFVVACAIGAYLKITWGDDDDFTGYT